MDKDTFGIISKPILYLQLDLSYSKSDMKWMNTINVESLRVG